MFGHVAQLQRLSLRLMTESPSGYRWSRTSNSNTGLLTRALGSEPVVRAVPAQAPTLACPILSSLGSMIPWYKYWFEVGAMDLLISVPPGLTTNVIR